ncbi:hypothetical protein [Salinicoccus sp. HZC-1]|uniref:hypothetical protein n=1 Tax=Salinicoccus sp. HZC-1 TaxID=3385497 RepID=UPI00398A8175
MAMFVAENEEQLIEVFKKVAMEMQPQQARDERIYLSLKEFSEDTGVSVPFIRTHILYEERFKKYVSQIDRKIYIKRIEGRRALQRIMDDYRR